MTYWAWVSTEIRVLRSPRGSRQASQPSAVVGRTLHSFEQSGRHQYSLPHSLFSHDVVVLALSLDLRLAALPPRQGMVVWWCGWVVVGNKVNRGAAQEQGTTKQCVVARLWF
eukprot:m.109740 g.109740  ORF g.109740 m.109740 type:complete len:112 (+) comp15994_c4_seq2:1533-1868(+)